MMNVLFIGTEAAPFAKSGGLGDVLGALPKALTKEGVNAAVILPLYKSIQENYIDEMEKVAEFETELAWRKKYAGIYKAAIEGVDYYFIDNQEYLMRDGYYGYFDDGERFSFFCKAALDSLEHIGFNPDIIHANEWQTALVPVYLKTNYAGRPEYDRIRAVFTIHNIEYQGQFDLGIINDVFGIDEQFMWMLEYDGRINLLKAAIVACDRLTTVSPRYAEEIQYSFYGRGLENIIQENSYKLTGILNGIDDKIYNPKRDKDIFVKYDLKSIESKYENKNELQKCLGLWEDNDVRVVSMITRLTHHKGIDLVMSCFDELMLENIQFVLLAEGEWHYEDFFTEKEKEYDKRMVCLKGFSENLARKIYAGSDIFLMPSISEPCGLSQMIASRYGTIAVVRETGGLKDSIEAYNPETGKGNGVTFKQINAHDMLGAVKRAIELTYDEGHRINIITNALKSDFSWKKGAKEYVRLYKELGE